MLHFTRSKMSSSQISEPPENVTSHHIKLRPKHNTSNAPDLPEFIKYYILLIVCTYFAENYDELSMTETLTIHQEPMHKTQ